MAIPSFIGRRQWHPTPVLSPGKSHGWRSQVGCSPWGCWESDTTERLHFHFSLSCIGEGNGNPLQCSCLENPRDAEPGGLPSVGSYRVGHDWSDLAGATAVLPCVRESGNSWTNGLSEIADFVSLIRKLGCGAFALSWILSIMITSYPLNLDCLQGYLREVSAASDQASSQSFLYLWFWNWHS